MTALLCALLAPGVADAAKPRLKAGVGEADITPQTGYVLGGWTRADRLGRGVHTRLRSRALVLERAGRKYALVQADLFMIPGGMVHQIGQALASRGFSERNIMISATHTHSGPGGFANFPTLNTTAPSTETINDPGSFARLLNPSPADPMLYTFIVNQITKAIQRADDDRAQATAGWGSAKILGLTQNRSIEAHLADHGIIEARGQGSAAQDPGGYVHTIDPEVNVLRVDKFKRVKGKLKRVPIGGWSTFANHGTVTKSDFQYYTEDHQASAMRVFEARVREEGRPPKGQQVLNVFANSNEGDQSAGLNRDGPAASDYVGRVEAGAMLDAWRSAKKHTTRYPTMTSRWTRVCFCGQTVENNESVASESQVGIPFLTGSEEGRGPLYDATGQIFEDRRGPDRGSPHGDKLSVPGVGAGVPNGVPLLAMRFGTRMIVSLPGEGTKEVGARIKSAVRSAVAGSGVKDVVLAGLTNEFILYITTPEEYDRQHYEGGNTQFGRQESNLLKSEITDLAGRLVRGQPAQAPYAFDPTNGIRPDGPAYGSGAASASTAAEPAGSYARLQRATFSWIGSPKGLDRPVDRAFMTAQRKIGTRWVSRGQDDDLGLNMLWNVNDEGRYNGEWEIPRGTPPGTYRLLVTGKRYRLASRSFRVFPSTALRVDPIPAPAGKVTVRLLYPSPVTNVDISYRPKYARAGSVRFKVGRRFVTAKRTGNQYFTVKAPAGVRVSIPAHGARDGFKNTNAAAVTVR